MTATPTISIVGVGCRYPDADDPEQLWQNVLAGRRAFRRLPEARLGPGFRGPADDPDRTYVTHAAVLRDWEFDRAAFGVSGALYRAADQTHWLALETAAAALADAGFERAEGLDRDAVGVVVGNSLTGETSRAASLRTRWPFLGGVAADALAGAGVGDEVAADVLARMRRGFTGTFPPPGDESLAGGLSNTIAGRICNVFDLHGTGYTVDGACSSSLLAVQAACTALVAGECDVMVAGGVDVSLDPVELVGFARLGALAAGDEMRVFDAEATGFLPGEGCGMVVLTRAEHAGALGLRVYADIVGWATSSDGAGGLTRPDVRGQTIALRRAYRRAGLEPAAAGLIEAHGTGTAVGDAVELEALIAARGRGRARAALGSVKANVGHTKAAAGVAGLLKATAAVHRGVLPPTVGCVRPHPLLTGDDVPLRLLSGAHGWDTADRIAGVSSFGFGGINAHVVLRSAERARPAARMSVADRGWARGAGEHEIVVAAADGADALAAELWDVAATAGDLSTAEVRDLAATRWRRRRRGHHRAALVARTPAELVTAARAAADAVAAPDAGVRVRFDPVRGWAAGSGRPARVGLLLPGQAAPAHTDVRWWARPGGLLDGLDEPDGTRPDTAVTQPWITAQTVLGIDWLAELGCPGEVATGHSLGEIAALYWAGSLTRDEAVRLAAGRGRAMAAHGEPGTGMVSLDASPNQATALLDGTDAVVAARNAPDRTVVSGRRADLEVVLARAADAGVRAVPLPVSHGFHSPAMLGARDSVRELAHGVDWRAPARRVVSSTTGKESALDGDPDGFAALLVAQLTEPVLFDDAVTAVADGADLLVEAGPGDILTGLAERAGLDVPAVALDVGGPPRRHAFATAVLAACAGADLEPWFAGRPHRLLPGGPPRFLANPAGHAPAGGVATGSTRTDPHPHPEPVPDGSRAVVDPAPEPSAVRRDGDPMIAVTAYLAAALELPETAVRPDHTLLGDLHLSSLQATQTVSAVAAELGVPTPPVPASIGTLTVQKLADAVSGSAAEPAGPAPVAGVRPWVRAFTDRWSAVSRADTGPVHWTVEAADDHPWQRLSRASAPADGVRRGLAVALAPTGVADVATGAEGVAALVRRVLDERPDVLLIGHRRHPAAAGLARALRAELDDLDVTVVDLAAADPAGVDPQGLASGPEGFRELRVTADGDLLARSTVPRDPRPGPDTGPVLATGDVCLVTGGVDGVTAHCAVRLAERTGAVPVFLGRTAADDARVRDGLAGLCERVPAHYVRADLSDPADVEAAVAAAAEHGPVRGLLHGAAVNEPRVLDGVTAASLRATLAPKVTGLDLLLRAMDGDTAPALVVAFGSVIGRSGLAGQSEYGVANDWMRLLLEERARERPGVRAHLVEWSVWAGTGMAVRMGVLDSMRARGVEPMDPDAATGLLLDLLDDPDTPPCVLATSRFAPVATVRVDGPPPPMLRFTQRVPVHLPGIEAVLEADLTPGDDPYLAEHRVDGVPVLPAVVALEAMAQAASAVTGVRPPERGWAATGLRFPAPVVVGGSGTTVRTAALAGPGGSVDVVLRDGSDAFGSERCAGTVVDPGPEPAAGEPIPPPDVSVAVHGFYGPVLFHEGRFRRVLRYDLLTAFRVRAWIDATASPGFFGPFHAPELLLGDPAAADAVLHALLPCVPHRLALPVGAERYTVRHLPDGPVRVDAAERGHGDGEYVFDVEVTAPDGRQVARWDGLLLRATGPERGDLDVPEPLLVPWLARRLLESGEDDVLDVPTPAERGVPDGGVVVDDVRGDPAAAAAAAARLLAGVDPGPARTGPDGIVRFGCGVVAAVRRASGQDVVVAARSGGATAGERGMRS